MDYKSFQFILFLPAIVALYYMLPHKYRWVLMLSVSLMFAAFYSISSPIVMIGIIIINFFSAKIIEKTSKPRSKHKILILSLIVNIIVLGLFKYYNGINRGSSFLSSLLGIENPVPFIEWLLPIGISYYIFQSIGYNIEIYRGTQKAESQFGIFAEYLSFFPKLIAGPIEKAHNLIPQLKTRVILNYENISKGGRLILWGLFKKIVIAGQLKLLIDPVFNNNEQYHGLPLLIAVFLYTLEIYADFSGYTDIAIGSARLFGIKLTQNFNRPFVSESLSELWRRWHITLSGWVSEYVFMPMSMWVSLRLNLKKWGIILSVSFSFLLLGLWHGAAWTFAVFGAVQGIILAIEILTINPRKQLSAKISSKVYRPFSIILTFVVFSFSCIFFRSNSVDGAVEIMTQSLNFSFDFSTLLKMFQAGMSTFALLVTLLFLVSDHVLFKAGFEGWCDYQFIGLRWLIYASMIFAIIVLSKIKTVPFVYSGF